MNSIRIEEPCHENWNQMNPTQRGAFCQKCEIDVHDFSKLNLSEIKQVLLENKGQHLCGRFEKNQLLELNEDFDSWKNNHPKTFQSRFVYALLLVFGLTLFSCNDEQAKEIAPLLSTKIQAALAEPDIKIANDLFLNMDAIIADEMIMRPEPPELIYEEQMLGEIQVQDYPVQDVIYRDHIQGMIAGGISMDYRYLEYIETTVDTVKESTLAPEIINEYAPFETKLFPNPTQTSTTLSIYVKTTANFKIEVYSFTGQLVDVIYNAELVEGRQNFEIDLSRNRAGTYFVKVWSTQQEETVKVIKLE